MALVQNSRQYPIFTEKTECRDCYKCVRGCPVKAIRVRDGSAVVDHSLCIFCGHCVDVCPAEAKKVRDDVSSVKKLLAYGRQVYVSLAPSYTSEFAGHEQVLISALQRLGFAGVRETAVGAQLISSWTDELLQAGKNAGRPMLSTACPSVVELIMKYYPDHVSKLAQLPSPLRAHAAELRKQFGPEISVVFIGPCIAKKLESDRHPEEVDAVLTYQELSRWLRQAGIRLGDSSPEGNSARNSCTAAEEDFFIPEAAEAVQYAVEGGMTATLHNGSSSTSKPLSLVSISGTRHTAEYLDELNQLNTPAERFAELLACEGGCLNGSGCTSTASLVRKKTAALVAAEERMRTFTRSSGASGGPISAGKRAVWEDVPVRFVSADVPDACPDNEAVNAEISQRQLDTVMRELGKNSRSDMLNCGGCGYNSCRDFAVAYIRGMAEKEMCVTHMRKLAQRKVDMLLRTIPMGVVIVDNRKNIADCNTLFLKMFASLGYEPDRTVLERVIGLPVQNFINLEQSFETILKGGETCFEKRIEHTGSSGDQFFLKTTFFEIDPGRLAGAIMQDITFPTVKRETVIKKAESVIKKNMESVQQIASLLGENAAETEIILNSLIDTFQVPYDRNS